VGNILPFKFIILIHIPRKIEKEVFFFKRCSVEAGERPLNDAFQAAFLGKLSHFLPLVFDVYIHSQILFPDHRVGRGAVAMFVLRVHSVRSRKKRKQMAG